MRRYNSNAMLHSSFDFSIARWCITVPFLNCQIFLPICNCFLTSIVQNLEFSQRQLLKNKFGLSDIIIDYKLQITIKHKNSIEFCLY